VWFQHAQDCFKRSMNYTHTSVILTRMGVIMTHQYDYDNDHSTITTLSSVIFTRRERLSHAVWFGHARMWLRHSRPWFQHTQEWFLHAECDFDTYECDFGWHECAYNTYECDLNTHKSDFIKAQAYFGTHNNKIHTIYKQTSVFVVIFSTLIFCIN
jgi:hypothetical protein